MPGIYTYVKGSTTLWEAMRRPVLLQTHWEFVSAVDKEFHRVQKKQFFAWNYGNYKATLTKHDFDSMYMMGGEL